MKAPIRYEIVSLNDVAARGLTPALDEPLAIALVVDDEPLIADTLALILNGSGIVTSAAYDAGSALESARIIPPNVLITDMDLPGMTGIELAIIMQKEIPDCRILLFSGKANTADALRRASQQNHQFSILAKPIYPGDLLAELSRVGCGPRPSADGLFI